MKQMRKETKRTCRREAAAVSERRKKAETAVSDVCGYGI